MKITNYLRRQLWRVTLSVGFAVSVVLPAFSQAPPNDNFTSRFVLTGLTAVASGNNQLATRETGEPAHAGSPAYASLWWTWQAPCDGVVQFTVTNFSNPLTRWAWYTGDALTNLSVVATNSAATNRVVEFVVVSNTVYQIAVDRLYWSVPTTFTLRLGVKTLLLAEPLPESRLPAGIAANLRVRNTETEHALARVDYFVSGNLAATTNQDPFDCTWAPGPPGRYSVMARATNSIGELRESPLIWINVVPPNDFFSGPAIIPGGAVSYELAGENLYATAEAGEPAHAGRAARKSLWWSWTPKYSGLATFKITSDVYAPSLAIYTGEAITNLTVVAANTNSSAPLQAQFNAQAGTTYRIAVDGSFGGSNGAVRVQMNLATLLLAEPLPESRIAAGSAAKLRVLNTETDHPLARVDYFASSNVVASTDQAPFDASWVPSVPGRYSVMARATNSIAERRESPVVWINVVPSNDFFVGPTIIPGDVVSYELAGENLYATAEPGEPAHAGQAAKRSLWWSWTPQYSGLATFTITSDVYGPSLAIYTGDAITNLALVTANTNSSAPLQAQFNAQAGTTYRIAVDGMFSGPNGDVRVQLNLTTLRFVNAPWLHTTTGKTLNLAITNYESDHPIEVLQVLLGSNVVTDALTGPWIFQWGTNVPGEYTFSCSGTNSAGQTRVSDVLTVLVSPANDDFADALEIPSLADQIAYAECINAFATREPGEPVHYAPYESGSVWFAWTAPWSGRAYFSTEGSSISTYIAIYTGDCLTNLTLVSTNSSTIVPVQQGVRYHIAAVTTGGWQGPARISIYPPPPNNDFAAALELSGTSGTFSGSNYSANPEPGEPLSSTDTGASIWWRWLAPSYGDFVLAPLDTSGSTALYAVYLGSEVSNLTTVVAPMGVGVGSAPSFRARPGRSYYLRFSGGGANPMYGQLSASYTFTQVTNVPANDYFEDRIALPGATNLITADNSGASIEPGEPVLGGYPCSGKTLWWSFTAPEKGLFQVYTEGIGFGTAWGIFRGNQWNALTLAQANWGPNSIRVDLQAGEEVQIAVDGTFGAAGPLTLKTEFYTVPLNDAFTNSIHLQGTNVAVSGENFAASTEPGEYLPAGLPGRTVWYSWAAPTTGKVTVRTWLGAVYTGAAIDHLNFIKAGNGEFTFMAEEGRVYHLQVDGGGWFNLSLDLLPCPGPPNDNFANAYELYFYDYMREWLALATAEPGEPAHMNGPFKSLWWRYEAPINGTLDVWRVDGSATNVVIAIYSGTSLDTLSLLNKGTNRAIADVTCRSLYYIAVAADPSCNGEIMLRAGVTGHSSPTTIPGNLLCDASFETGQPDCWQQVGGSVYFMNQGPMDGQYYLALGASSSIYQDFDTVPGRVYQVRFAYCANVDQSLARANVKWDTNLLGQVSVLSGQQTVWNWAEFTVVATNTRSRLTIENMFGVFSIDCASVLRMDEPPSIVQPPASVSTLAGGTAAFSVVAGGTAPLAYQWWFADSPLPAATRKALSLNCVTTNQAGQYFVVVTNGFGSITSAPARLYVESPASPTIVLQPYSDNVPVGGYFALSVAAVGSPPLSYQWFLNGSPLTDATNRHLVFPAFQTINAGTYTVRVSNLTEGVVSLPATLTPVTNLQSGGLVLMANRFTEVGVSSEMPIFDYDGATKLNCVDSDYVAQLYAGPTIAALRPVSSLRTFLSGFDAGIFNGEWISLPNVQAGSLGYFQVRVWQREYGLSYEEARALGSKFGRSEIVTCYPGGTPPGLPPTPGRVVSGWHSFNLQAGMPEFIVGRIQLSGRNPDGTAVWSLQGQAGYLYLIERCTTNLMWQPFTVLTNSTGSATFSDPAPSNPAWYRARILE